MGLLVLFKIRCFPVVYGDGLHPESHGKADHLTQPYPFHIKSAQAVFHCVQSAESIVSRPPDLVFLMASSRMGWYDNL